MTGQRVGYLRVSTVEQNTDRQLYGIDWDRVFTDAGVAVEFVCEHMTFTGPAPSGAVPDR
jgi:hypothetical protein